MSKAQELIEEIIEAKQDPFKDYPQAKAWKKDPERFELLRRTAMKVKKKLGSDQIVGKPEGNNFWHQFALKSDIEKAIAIYKAAGFKAQAFTGGVLVKWK